MPKDLICKKGCSYDERKQCGALNHFDKGEPAWIVAERVGGLMWAESVEAAKQVDDPRSQEEVTLEAAIENIKEWYENGNPDNIEFEVTWDEDNKQAIIEATIPRIGLEVYIASEELAYAFGSNPYWGLDEKTGRAILLPEESS